MNSLGPPSAVSLFSLSNELLLEIINHVALGQSRDPKSTPLKTLSLVNRHFRELVRPILLRSIILASEFDEIRNDYNWSIMDAAFTHLHSSANLLRCIKKLQMDLVIFDSKLYPHAEPACQTINLLLQLPNLEHLLLLIPPVWNPNVKEMLEKRASTDPLEFSKVTTLIIEQTSVYLLEYFTQTHHLGLYNDCETGLDEIELPKYAKYAPHVTHFEAISSWYHPDFHCLDQSWPEISHLGVWPAGHFNSALGLRGRFKHLKVLGMTELIEPRLGTNDISRVFGFFRDTETISVEWIRVSNEYESDEDEEDEGDSIGEEGEVTKMLLKEFMHEHYGSKIFKDMVDNLFWEMPELDEIWFGDMVGARRVEENNNYDHDEDSVSFQGGPMEEDWWSTNVEWLGDYFHRPDEERRQFNWLLRPIHFAGVNSKQ